MECVSSKQSNCPIDYRLTILGIEFDFRFRIRIWNVKWSWEGESQITCWKSRMWQMWFTLFSVWGDLGQSLGSDACHAVDCNKLGQVRHKTIGSPKKEEEKKKRSCCSTCRVPRESDELNGLNMHEPGRERDTRRGRARERERGGECEWDSDTPT